MREELSFKTKRPTDQIRIDRRQRLRGAISEQRQKYRRESSSQRIEKFWQSSFLGSSFNLSDKGRVPDSEVNRAYQDNQLKTEQVVCNQEPDCKTGDSEVAQNEKGHFEKPELGNCD